MPQILMPIPSTDFDPTETAIPWKILKKNGFKITFATPAGKKAECDQKMLLGKSLGPWKKILMADANAVKAYLEMAAASEFENPISWNSISNVDFDGLILPGGHAPGMKEYLESEILQKCVADFFEKKKPVGAICHGVVLAARSKMKNGKSVLYGHKTTALLKSQEMSAWMMTVLWLKNYYRTYPQSVEDEVKSQLKLSSDFLSGPSPLFRDGPQNLNRGFTVTSDKYVSARWPGDAHAFTQAFIEIF